VLVGRQGLEPWTR